MLLILRNAQDAAKNVNKIVDENGSPLIYLINNQRTRLW
jgi:hypothetical protein